MGGGRGLPLSVVSDGFGLHVRPLLAAAGLRTSPSSRTIGSKGDWDSAHPICVGCGTCKKQAVERARTVHGTVAFVGDGVTIASAPATRT